jgi:hypothetical protein
MYSPGSENVTPVGTSVAYGYTHFSITINVKPLLVNLARQSKTKETGYSFVPGAHIAGLSGWELQSTVGGL